MTCEYFKNCLDYVRDSKQCTEDHFDCVRHQLYLQKAERLAQRKREQRDLERKLTGEISTTQPKKKFWQY
jgi:hypothetical protein